MMPFWSLSIRNLLFRFYRKLDTKPFLTVDSGGLLMKYRWELFLEMKYAGSPETNNNFLLFDNYQFVTRERLDSFVLQVQQGCFFQLPWRERKRLHLSKCKEDESSFLVFLSGCLKLALVKIKLASPSFKELCGLITYSVVRWKMQTRARVCVNI